MPIFGLETTLNQNANRILVQSFLPRFKEQVWSKIGAPMPPSRRYVEPFTILGSAPLLARFNGKVTKHHFNSWRLQVPMMLFKAWTDISRADMEFDQTGFLMKALAQVGARCAQTPDFALASKMMRGHLAASATETSDVDGQTYNATFEAGVPYYSANHTFDGLGSAGTQSNIITGNLPATAAEIVSAEVSAIVQALQKDLTAIITRIATWLDDKGAQMYPQFDTAKHLVIVYPPCLRQAMQLVYNTGNATVAGAGGASGASGSTTNIANTLIKDSFSFSLLQGCTDVYDEELATLTPSAQTAYYAYIMDDFVRPFYWMPFMPPKGDDLIPRGSQYDAAAEAARVLALAKEAGVDVTPQAADAYAATIIDHNLGAIGANAQRSVAETEQFFMAPRQRGNWVYGPWFTGLKIVPTGQSS